MPPGYPRTSASHGAPPAPRAPVGDREGTFVIRTSRCRAVVTRAGQNPPMGIVILLIVLALIFGVGSVLEGIAWGFLIVAGLVVAAAVLGFRAMSGSSSTRT